MKNFIARYRLGKGLWMFTKVTIGIILASIIFVGFQNYRASRITPPEAYGLATSTPADTHLHGQLYFSATENPETSSTTLPSIYRYDIGTKDIVPVVSGYPANSFAHGTADFDIMTAYIASSSDPDHIVPAWYHPVSQQLGELKGVGGYYERDIAASPDQTHYAFSYRTAKESDGQNLDNWNVAIIDHDNGDVTTITAAAKPHWMNDGADLLYLKSDGIYRYNLKADASEPVFTRYAHLSNTTDFTVAPDSSSLVLTAPTANLISVIQVLDSANVKLQEKGSIVTGGERYRYPVISPDGRFYAVMHVKEADYASSTGDFSRADIQVRPLDSQTVIDTIPVPGFTPSSVALRQWYTK